MNRKTSPPSYDISDRISRVSIALDRINRIARGEFVEPEQGEFAFTFSSNTHTASPPAEPETH